MAVWHGELEPVSRIGLIMPFWSDTPPTGWFTMNGQTIAGGAAAYPALAARYPTWVAGADLVLPNWSSRFPRHHGGAAGLPGTFLTALTGAPTVPMVSGGATVGAVQYPAAGAVNVGEFGLQRRSPGGNNSTFNAGGAGSHRTAPPTTHSHTVIGLGDAETAPVHTVVNYCVLATDPVPATVSDAALKSAFRHVPVDWDSAPAVVRYTPNDAGRARGVTEQVGWIAQDVAAAYPDAVLRDTDGYLHIDYDAMVLRLVGLVKELAGCP